MSYILDALRKSQQARQPGSAPRTGAVHNISLALPVSGWWLVLGLVLLLGIVAAVLLFWRNTVAHLPDPPPAPVTIDPVAAAPASAPPASVPATESPASKTAPVADLAEQAKLPAPAPSPKKVTAARTVKKPALTPRPETVKTVSAPAVPLVMDDTPLLQQMPQDFQRALPALAVTIHVYSHDESQRILFINNREYRKGSQIDGGVRVEDIVPDGVVLSFRGERFKLGRPR
ncbi:MAG: general secretion pathway protein GspB [Pseudomonadota bacterium]